MLSLMKVDNLFISGAGVALTKVDARIDLLLDLLN